MSAAHPAMTPERLRHRAQLVEFLKFRVLASQEAFFSAWLPEANHQPKETCAPLAELDLSSFRSWITPLWPTAVRMSDEDLRHGLEQAHHLYVDSPARQQP